MVVGERLPPIRHREVGLGLLRELELGDGLFPPEAVENRHAAKEVLLGGGRSRRGERQLSNVLQLGGGGRDEREGDDSAEQ